MNSQPAPASLRRQGFLERLAHGVALSVFSLLAVPAILGGKNLSAQADAPQSTKPAQHQKAVARPAQSRRRTAAHARVASVKPQPAPEAIAAPPVPPAPIWPADQPPSQAEVTWDSRGLEIEAHNSSLIQILRQVAADTGAKLQEPSQDQRIFGTYGPGPARDVLSKLLDGSGYNVLMIGGRDTHAPLEIVLSVSPHVSPQAAANDRNHSISADDEADPPPEPPSPPPMVTPFGNGDSGKPENPPQIMEDILDRQHKLDQRAQQQQDQQNNPQQ